MAEPTRVQDRVFDFTGNQYADAERGSNAGQYCLINVGVAKGGGTGSSNSYPAMRFDGSRVVIVNGSRTGTTEVNTNGTSLQIVTSVALPMPTNPGVAYGADWTIDGVSLSERAVASAADIAQQAMKGTFDMSQYGLKNVITANLKNQAVKYGYSTALRKTLKDSGLAYNPHKELFYAGPTFRAFSLDWQFSFKNKQEADRFFDLVEVLAEHQHPEFDEGQTTGVWTIPDTFFFEYVNANTRKFGACVCTNVDARYANSGAGWKAFEDGNPAHVALTVNFLEISPLSRKDIRQGK